MRRRKARRREEIEEERESIAAIYPYSSSDIGVCSYLSNKALRDSRWVRGCKRDRTGFNGRTRAPNVTPPEVRLMRPSGVTRHLASGTTITFGIPIFDLESRMMDGDETNDVSVSRRGRIEELKEIRANQATLEGQERYWVPTIGATVGDSILLRQAAVRHFRADLVGQSAVHSCVQEMSQLAKLFYPNAGIASVSFSVNDRSCATICRTDKPEASAFISWLFSSATGQPARVDSDSGG
ncbi:hypothetical protein ALC53_10379 [Atta colombica]|uniref:Uncharacterized protein n=1 Tax=Atta colombica TaxID=520822 RepID=A0A195B4V5_9HYME|nr:hypothetical protein ALC53_10379 [Atta colombica]